MKFDIRSSYRGCNYQFVKVTIDNATFDLGLLGPQERKELAVVLREAADELYEMEEDQNSD